MSLFDDSDQLLARPKYETILNSILNKIKVKKPCVKRTSGLVIYLGPCHLQRTFHAMFVGMEFPLLDYDIMAYVPYVVPAHP